MWAQSRLWQAVAGCLAAVACVMFDPACARRAWDKRNERTHLEDTAVKTTLSDGGVDALVYGDAVVEGPSCQDLRHTNQACDVSGGVPCSGAASCRGVCRIGCIDGKTSIINCRDICRGGDPVGIMYDDGICFYYDTGAGCKCFEADDVARAGAGAWSGG